MTWQLLLIAYSLLNTATYLLQRHLGKTLFQHKRLVSAFFFVGLHYPMGLLVAFYSSPHLHIGWLNMLLLLAGSWVFPLVNIMFLKASKHVDAGHFTVLSNLTPIITIIAASLLLKEDLNAHQLVGAIIIITAAFLATVPHIKRGHDTKEGLTVALTAFVLTGLATVYERWMLTRIGLGAYLIFGWGAQTFWMLLIAWPQRKHLGILKQRRHAAAIWGYALAGSIKGVCFIIALRLIPNTSLFSVVISLTPVLVVPAAYFALHERQNLGLKVLSAVAATIGLIVLNLR